MDHIDPTTLTALLLSLFLLLYVLWAQRRRGPKANARHARSQIDEALDTVQDFPPQVVRILSLPERQAYNILRKAVPGHLILAQVPLSRFISVPTRNPYGQWLQRVGRLTVDLAVCDFSSRVVAVVEVRTGDETSRSRKRHERVAQVLQAAGLQVHVWNADSLPTIPAARQLFIRQEEAEESTFVDTNGRRMIPVAEIQELLAAGDNADYGTQEPVPSTFFDDLDALPPNAHLKTA
jgi:cbb3-type cytochrome oxidase subunit 3